MKKLAIIVLIMTAAFFLSSGVVFSQGPDFGTISGMVTNQGTDEPIEHAVVKAYGADSPHWPVGQAFSDEEGNYTLNVPYGDYVVQAEKFGFVPEWWEEVPERDSATVVTVGEDNNPEGIDFTLAAISNDLGTISGTVTDAASGDPLADAHVSLRRADDNHFHRDVMTGEDGTYTFDDVRAGTYMLECGMEGYIPMEYPDPVMVNGDDITGIDFALQELVFGSISGTVTDAGTGDPLAGVHVVAEMVGDHHFHHDATTGDDGTYMIDELPPGDYTVHAGMHDYYSQDYPDTLTINGDDFTGIDFALEPFVFGGISGVVTDAGTSEPVAMAVVTAVGDNWPHNYRWALTDSLGEYSMVLLAGEYTIEVHARGYVPFTSEEPIVVADSVTTYDIALMGIELGSISGTVYSDSNIAIPDASVDASMHHCWFHMRTHTDSLGNYMFEDVYPGSYTLRAFAQGYRSQTYDSLVVVENGADVTGIDFNLVPYDHQYDGYISGVVTDDSTGEPIVDAMLFAWTSQNGFRRWVRRAHTDENGAYTFSNLPDAPFKILCTAHGYHSEYYDNKMSWRDADPVTPDAENIDFGLGAREYGPRFFSGRVFESDLPVDGALVTATLNGEIVDITASYSDGFYSFENMIPGNYNVEAVGLSENQASLELAAIEDDYYDADIILSPTGVDDQANALPTQTELLQNYPNPFNATTNIQFYLASEGEAELSIYDLLGRKVSTLVSGTQTAGMHTFNWNGQDSNGRQVSSGMYLYVLKTADNTYSNRMLLLK